jgi:hypothetical protein
MAKKKFLLKAAMPVGPAHIKPEIVKTADAIMQIQK